MVESKPAAAAADDDDDDDDDKSKSSLHLFTALLACSRH